MPQLLRSLDEAAFRRTLLPKVQGLRNLLAAINADRLRILVSFGSIIARTGMRGEADYAVANEWLSRLTERQRAVMQRRFGLGGAPVQSLAEIGRDLGITRERARQIQEEALRKLRTKMEQRDNPSEIEPAVLAVAA